MYLREIGWWSGQWIQLAQDKDWCLAYESPIYATVHVVLS